VIHNILETDQVKCYDERGLAIECSGTGQDAEDKTGTVHSGSRFQNRGDVAADTLTSLFWSLDANLLNYPLTWKEAHNEIHAMNTANLHGHSDWKLPTRSELFSLISHQYQNPSLPQDHPFQNVFPGYYWTETLCARLPDQAWYLHLGGGRIYRGMKQSSYMVWPVRTPGRRKNRGRLTPVWVEGEYSACDQSTGLMWLKNADRVGKPVTWQSALKAIKELNIQNVAGYSDWRLPNIRELESLVDLSVHSPALPAGHPFKNVAEGYWSSTTSVYEPAYAWVLYTRDGAVGVGYKVLAEFNVWVVRRGNNQ